MTTLVHSRPQTVDVCPGSNLDRQGGSNLDRREQTGIALLAGNSILTIVRASLGKIMKVHFFWSRMQPDSRPPRKALVALLMCSAMFFSACGSGDAPGPALGPAPATAGTATLSWTAPAGSVAGYRVYYGTASRSYSQALGSGTVVTGTTFTISSLPAGYTYYFAVTAFDDAGVESAYSNEASKLIP
jgi:Fibronectin type III domain